MEEQCCICTKWFKDEEIYKNIPHTDIYYCKECYFHGRPERSKREDLTTISPLPKELEKYLVEEWERSLLS